MKTNRKNTTKRMVSAPKKPARKLTWIPRTMNMNAPGIVSAAALARIKERLKESINKASSTDTTQIVQNINRVNKMIERFGHFFGSKKEYFKFNPECIATIGVFRLLNPSIQDTYLSVSKKGLDTINYSKTREVLYARYMEILCSYVILRTSNQVPNMDFWYHILPICTYIGIIVRNFEARIATENLTPEQIRIGISAREGFYFTQIVPAIVDIVKYYAAKEKYYADIEESFLGCSLEQYLKKLSRIPEDKIGDVRLDLSAYFMYICILTMGPDYEPLLRTFAIDNRCIPSYYSKWMECHAKFPDWFPVREESWPVVGDFDRRKQLISKLYNSVPYVMRGLCLEKGYFKSFASYSNEYAFYVGLINSYYAGDNPSDKNHPMSLFNRNKYTFVGEYVRKYCEGYRFGLDKKKEIKAKQQKK